MDSGTDSDSSAGMVAPSGWQDLVQIAPGVYAATGRGGTRVVIKAFHDHRDANLAAAGIGALLLPDQGKFDPNAVVPNLVFVGREARQYPPCKRLGTSGLVYCDAELTDEGVALLNTRKRSVVDDDDGTEYVPKEIRVLPLHTRDISVVSERLEQCRLLKPGSEDVTIVFKWLCGLAETLSNYGVHLTDLKADNIVYTRPPGDPKGKLQPKLIDWDQVVHYAIGGDYRREEPRSCTTYFNYVNLMLANDPDRLHTLLECGAARTVYEAGLETVKLVFDPSGRASLERPPVAKAYLPLEALTTANIALCDPRPPTVPPALTTDHRYAIQYGWNLPPGFGNLDMEYTWAWVAVDPTFAAAPMAL